MEYTLPSSIETLFDCNNYILPPFLLPSTLIYADGCPPARPLPEYSLLEVPVDPFAQNTYILIGSAEAKETLKKIRDRMKSLCLYPHLLNYLPDAAEIAKSAAPSPVAQSIPRNFRMTFAIPSFSHTPRWISVSDLSSASFSGTTCPVIEESS